MPHRSLLDYQHFEAATMGDTVAGAADYRGQPASRAATGGWKSSIFVMGTRANLS
jgi:peptide/histidine transporter 3/4